MVSFIDCSRESDKIPILFGGDIFNFYNLCDMKEEIKLE